VPATRRRYVALAPEAATRIDFVVAPGEQPRADDPVDFVFIDGAHDKDTTTAAFEAWRGRLADGGTIVFHDYESPGVTSAIAELGLAGRVDDGMYFWPS